MQKTYGMPYLEESFYGMTDTAKALRDIARELDNIVNGLEKRVMQERVSAAKADGIIFAAPSFCDPALLDQPMLRLGA
jgi:nitrogenase molybdenum-iron protein alpha/beta subunit